VSGDSRAIAGGYRLGPEIAHGAMGGVHRAVAADGRLVAAKRLLDERQSVRFEIEGRLLRRLDHPRVVNVLDAVDDPSGRYLIMEWVEGEDLAARLRRLGRPGLPVDEVIRHGLQAAEALRYVHEQQTVHRDVKPQNLMLSPDRGIVVVDFGIARDLAEEGATQGIGTPGYMAPEALAGGPYTPRTDVYGLAATLWRLITGRMPPWSPFEPPPGVEPALGATLVSALAVDPVARPASMEALVEAMGGVMPAHRGRDIAVSAAVRAGVSDLLEAVVRTAAGVFGAAATSLALRRGDGGLVYEAAWGAGANEIVGFELGPGKGIAGRVVSTGEGEVISDCRADPDFVKVAVRVGYVPHTMIVVPLLDVDRVAGVLTVFDRRDGEPFGLVDLARAELFAELALAALHSTPALAATLAG